VLKNKSGNISETHKDREKVTMDGLQELANALSNRTITTPYATAPPINLLSKNKQDAIARGSYWLCLGVKLPTVRGVARNLLLGYKSFWRGIKLQ